MLIVDCSIQTYIKYTKVIRHFFSLLQVTEEKPEMCSEEDISEVNPRIKKTSPKRYTEEGDKK